MSTALVDTSTSKSAASVRDVDVDAAVSHCLVCYSDLTYYAVTPCAHNEICAVCHLRLRFLHSDIKCPVCKGANERIIVDPHNSGGGGGGPEQAKPFSEYPMWGDHLGDDFVFEQDVGMFFPLDYYHEVIQPLFGHHCTLPSCNYTGITQDASNSSNNNNNSGNEKSDVNAPGTAPAPAAAPDNGNKNNQNSSKPVPPLRGLQDHLRTKHRTALCQLCIDHKRDFVSLLPRFKPDQLKRHLQTGDGAESGFTGHPVCEFCRPKRFYGVTGLHLHLTKDHYKCHVCDKQNIQNQFFKNYHSLEKHFDRQHFICNDVQCLTARFVVFENELDLRHHERQVHGGTSTGGSTKIQLEFRVRRTAGGGEYGDNQDVPTDQDFNYGMDGQAFVPQALPRMEDQTGGGGGLHPLHVERTAGFREQAAAIREANGLLASNANAEDSFPALESAAAAAADGSDPAMRVGWTSNATMQRLGRKKEAGAVTEEAFPSLGPSSASQRQQQYPANARLRAGGAATTTQRQFAAMQTSGNASTSNSGPSWGGSAVAGPPRPSTATPFMISSSAPGISRNSNTGANLSANNFPSLGGAAAPRATYQAANALTKQLQGARKPPPSWNSAIDFPAAAASAPPQQQQQRAAPRTQAPPSYNSTNDFPSMSASSQGTSVKQKMLGNQRKGPSQSVMANVLKAPSVTEKASLADMKATLGSTRYKKLKGLTKDFASDEMPADAYVDHSAALFDQGYNDPDFWSFLPSLLESCPNEFTANQALQYMDNLKRMKNGAMNAEAQLASNANRQYPANNWSATNPSVSAAPASSQQAVGNGGGWSSMPSGVTAAPPQSARPVAAPVRYAPPSPPLPSRTMPGKAKSAWGGAGGASTVVRTAKAKPGSQTSVTAALAEVNAKGNTGTATKFMAKHNKEQKHNAMNAMATGTAENKKGKKKKQKDELRSLAFGGK